MKLKSRQDYRRRRHARVRKKISGTAERPRMALMVSNKRISVQFIDDDSQLTLAAAATKSGEGKNVASATELGKRAAEAALGKGIRHVVIDRGGYKFHGRLKALVDAAAAAGLQTTTRPAEKTAQVEADGQDEAGTEEK